MKGEIAGILFALLLALILSLAIAVPVSAGDITNVSVTPANYAAGVTTDYNITFTPATGEITNVVIDFSAFGTTSTDMVLTGVSTNIGDYSFTGFSINPTGVTVNDSTKKITFTGGTTTASTEHTITNTIAGTGLVITNDQNAETNNVTISTASDLGTFALTINSATAKKLKITSAHLTLTAGTQGTVAVEIQDQYGNPQPAGAYTVNLASSSTGTYHFYTTGTQNIITSINIADGASSGTFDYYDEKAGTPIIVVSAIGLTPDTQQQTINPASASKLNITSAPLTLTAGTQGTVTVKIQDQFSNPQPAGAYTVNLASSSTGTYHFYTTGTQNIITSINIADGVSSGTFDYYDEKAGTPTLTVSDAGAALTPDTQQQTINLGTLASFTITGIPTMVLASATFPSPANDITVTAYDAWGNVKTDYVGTVTWSSSSAATLPADYTFVAGDAGAHTFPGIQFRLLTGSIHTITVTDAVASVSATSSGIAVVIMVPPPDTIPPIISSILASNITETSADISWETNESSTSQVEYWSSPSLLSPLDEAMCYSHLVHLTDLTPGTTYHYKAISRDSAGNLAISDEHTFATLGEAPAAAFSASDLSISPSEVNIKETVTISVLVANTGNLAGSYEVTLKINGLVEATRKVTINAGGSEQVTFTTAKDEAGIYSADVNGRSASFTVKKPAPSPPTTAPPAPPAKPTTNWPMIGGIIAAVIIVGLGIFFGVSKRRAV